MVKHKIYFSVKMHIHAIQANELFPYNEELRSLLVDKQLFISLLLIKINIG